MIGVFDAMAMRKSGYWSAGLAGLLAGAAVTGASAQTEAFIAAHSGDPDGRTVVLIPGLASSGEAWAATAGALAAYDVRTLTLAGFAGVPPRADGAPVIDGAARAIADMLAEEGLSDVALVGHSLGAQVALHAAVLAPDRVGQVVAVDSAPFYAGLTVPGATPEQATAFAEAAAAQMSAMAPEAFRAQQALGMERYSKDPDYIGTLVGWSEASDPATVVAGFAEVAGGDFRPVLAEVSAPVLAVVAYDPAMGVRRDLYEFIWRDQYSGAQDATVTLIDGSYHFVMHDQQGAFVTALTAFLEEAE